jgi:hypothetical protein
VLSASTKTLCEGAERDGERGGEVLREMERGEGRVSTSPQKRDSMLRKSRTRNGHLSG